MSAEPEDQIALADMPEDVSIGEAFTRLVDSGKDYARAELDKQKARAGLVGSGLRDALVLFTVGLIVFFAAIVALLIGLILILAPILTPAGATSAVIGGALLIAIILMLFGKRRIGRMTRALRP